MNDPSESERQRQERAQLVSAFNRRAWQPSGQPQLAPRVLAGGAALLVVAGASFGLGAMNSYNHKKAAQDHARQMALATQANPSSQNRLAGNTPSSTASAGSTPVPGPSRSQGGGRTGTGGAGVHNALPQAASGTGGTGGSGKSGRMGTHSVKSSTASGVLIKNVMTGMCVDIPNYGKGTLNGRVQQHQCDGSAKDNQRWDLVVGKGAGPGGADLFIIRNTKDGYCLDLPQYGPPPKSSDVTEWHCDPGPGDNQMWYLEKKAPGKFWIRNVASKDPECLDVAEPHGSGGPDAKLTIFPCSLQDDHQWSFVR